MKDYQLTTRLKRLRQSEASRLMLEETSLAPSQFIAPLFISANLRQKLPIQSMPGQYRLSLDDLSQEIEEISQLGIKSVLLFGLPAYKDALGSSALESQGIVQKAIAKIKEENPDILVISDLCFCEYTSHGHCGLLDSQGEIDNDKTLEALAQQAVSHAEAGVDWLAPSSMTDGMVKAIRQGLDEAGFIHKAILSYTVKYSSSLYGPFREAAEGAPQFGHRKAYQMSPANSHEALREAALDIEEGADLLMVKPANYYLDVIYRLKQAFVQVPLCAYQVSGEYSMLKAAAAQGFIQEKEAILESLIAIKRAGADLIISYFAKDAARFLRG